MFIVFDERTELYDVMHESSQGTVYLASGFDTWSEADDWITENED